MHHISTARWASCTRWRRRASGTGPSELTELAVAGASDVVARKRRPVRTAFWFPHSDPQYKPELVERYSYGWCHGPAGEAQVFG